MLGPIKLYRLMKALNAGRPLLPWVDPPDFTGREKTRLYASELDILREDLIDLNSRLGAIWPVGAMLGWAGNNVDASVPAGWVLCDGRALSTGSYAALFAVIGYTYGGSGTSFNLPDARGRVLVGAGAASGGGAIGTVRTRGGLIGVEDVTLALSQIPTHNHAASTGGQSQTHYHGLEGHQHYCNLPEVGDHRHGTGGDTGFRFAVSSGAAARGLHDAGLEKATFTNMDLAGGHGHDGWSDGAGALTGWQAANVDHSHANGSANQGGGGSHSNTQPGVVVGGAIIKT